MEEKYRKDQVLKTQYVNTTPVLKSHRLFISSTFQDMAIERKVLRERIFPKLRQLASQKGWTLRIIDLQ